MYINKAELLSNISDSPAVAEIQIVREVSRWVEY